MFHDPAVRWVNSQIKQSPAWRAHRRLISPGVLPDFKFQARKALLPLTEVILAEVFHNVVIVFIFAFASIADLGCWKCKGQSPSGSGRRQQQVALGTPRETAVFHPPIPPSSPGPPEHCRALPRCSPTPGGHRALLSSQLHPKFSLRWKEYDAGCGHTTLHSPALSFRDDLCISRLSLPGSRVAPAWGRGPFSEDEDEQRPSVVAVTSFPDGACGLPSALGKASLSLIGGLLPGPPVPEHCGVL